MATALGVVTCSASLGIPARRPPQPGQFLESRFLKPLGISQTDLAKALGVSRRRVNELINGRRAITPDTAVRLGVYFDNDAKVRAPVDAIGLARRLGMQWPPPAADDP